MKIVSSTIEEKVERNQEDEKIINMCDVTITIVEIKLTDKLK